MSRFKILDRARGIIRDLADRWRFWNRYGINYHVGGDEIGISKEYGLLDYKSDLNDPETWRTREESTPEGGGKQIYGTGTFEEWSTSTNVQETKGFFSKLGVKVPDSIASPLTAEYKSSSLHGPSTASALPEAKAAVYSKTANVDREDIQSRNVFGVIKTGEPEMKTRLRDSLGSPGISGKAHNREYHSYEDSKTVAKTFDNESNHYVDRGRSVIPSWYEDTTEINTERKKNEVVTKRKDTVQYISELYPDSTHIPRQYIKGETWATSSKKVIEEEPLEKSRNLSVGVLEGEGALSKNVRFSKIDKTEGTANALYGKPLEYSGEFDFPGGKVSSKLEYDKSMVDEELGLIPFCITTLTPNIRTYLNFPAHLESYEDNYTGNWDSVQYIGRAENFYGYTGFTRDISIGFKVIAANPQNLANLYSKLNRLAGGTAPSYDSTRLFMRGTLASITLGDLLRNQMGFIKNVRLGWEQDYLWEIGPVSPQDSSIAQAVQDMYGIAKGKVQEGFEREFYRIPQVLNVNLSFTPIEHGTVREDYNAYFVFDPVPEEQQIEENQNHKQRKVDASVSLARPRKPGDDWIWDYTLNNGQGGWRMRRDGEVDLSGIEIYRPGQYGQQIYGE